MIGWQVNDAPAGSATRIVIMLALMWALPLEAQPTLQSPRISPTAAHGPIIDMHLHAFGWDEYGDPPPPNEITGRIPEARSDDEALAATLAAMDHHGIVLAAASGPPDQVSRWQRAAPDRFLSGAYVSGRVPAPATRSLRARFEAGELQMIGELGLQYRGLAAEDPEVADLFSLATELDLPVGLHTGLGDAGTPYSCCPDFRAGLGSPLRAEEVLVRHPELRLYLMHAGYPYLAETIALLTIYPQVHVDIGVLAWALPRAEFHRYLKALVTAGFGGRILFGSDQMIWPEAIGMSIEGVATADFLDDDQKRDIFYWNAARFLRLDDAQIEAHHRQVGDDALSRATSRKIDEIVRAHMSERRIPAASIGIITEKGVVETAAYGTAVLQDEVPARVDTVYEIASLTKQFTAAAVLMLVDDGKLDLDDSIAETVESAPPTWRPITLRHLLSHTGGLASEATEFASLRGNWRRSTPRELMLASAMADPVREPPGAAFEYGSAGFFLAALAVEKASGMTFQDFLQERILTPLGMHDTFLQDELRIIPHEAQGYGIKNGRLVNIWRDGLEDLAGGWGLFSTVPDLVRWDRALRDRELLSLDAHAAMFTPVTLADGSTFRYGLGWWLPERNGIRYQYHSGTTGTEMLRIPDYGLTVVVLTNLGRSSSIGTGEALAWGLADRIASAIITDFALETVDLPLSDEALDAYVGLWRFEYGEARFFARDGRLWIEDAVGSAPMLYQGDDTFGFDGDPERLLFGRGADGRVVSATWISDVAQDDIGEPVADAP